MLAGKKFSSNEEAIADEREAHFEAKDRSFYKHGIEKLEKRVGMIALLLQKIVLTNWKSIFGKQMFFLS